MANWIDTTKQLPEDGSVVIIAIKGYVRPCIGGYEDEEWWLDDDAEEDTLKDRGLRVTHWQPLDEMPIL
jgi:hypothetical protein